MNVVTIGVSSIEESQKRLSEAFKGEPQGAYLSFASVELLWKTLTLKRLQLIDAMTGQGGMTIRETARRVGRDVKAVHSDMHALLDAGILERTEDGTMAFPYEAMHVDFTIPKAA